MDREPQLWAIRHFGVSLVVAPFASGCLAWYQVPKVRVRTLVCHRDLDALREEIEEQGSSLRVTVAPAKARAATKRLEKVMAQAP